MAENIHFLSSLYGMTSAQRRSRLDELLAFVDLAEAKDRLGSNLSGGMQRRLMLAGSLMHNPRLLFADEPTAGIDPVLRRRFWDYFRQLRGEGRTLLVTTQYVGEAAYCDYVAVMRAGRVLMVETPEEMRRKAMGGEIIQLTVPKDRRREIERFLDELPGVKDARTVPGTTDQLHLLVDRAGQMLPVVLKALADSLQFTPQAAEPYLPPFDDIFVKIMQDAEEAHD
ncbi:MAG: ABC transporter ATP-binding protein [Anaerolineales bacterium]|nr:ABC transporter ATP-binding protein [Anaerolineales bacterium]